MNKLCDLFVKTIGIVSIIILSFFTVNSLFFTYTIDISEKSFFHFGNFWALIVILAVIIICGYLKKQRGKVVLTQKSKKILFTCFIVLYTCFCILIIAKVGVEAKSDQEVVLDAARKFIKGDYGWMDTYLKIYPNQYGLILFECGLEKLPFVNTSNDILVFRVVNVIFLLLSYFIMAKITELFQNDKKYNLKLIIGYILFLPITLYILFVYGNIIGFSISMTSFYFLLLFLKNNKGRYAIISALLSVLAIVIKNNYLIVFIAELVVLMFNIVKEKKIKNIIVVALFIVLYVLSNKAINYKIYKITGEYPASGMPKLSWIEMGMQENPDKEAGWYNNENYDTFIEHGYDSDYMNQILKDRIKDRISYLVSNPKDLVSFLYRKIETQWNEPTFESLWIIDSALKIKGEDGVSQVALDFYYQESMLSKLYVKYCNVIHFIILFGALMYFILEYKNLNIYKVSLSIIILGGLLFHIIWEAKTQYIITYFILYIPYAIIGMEKLINLIIEKNRKRKLLSA